MRVVAWTISDHEFPDWIRWIWRAWLTGSIERISLSRWFDEPSI